MNKGSTLRVKKGSTLRQLVKNAINQNREIADMKTCSIINKEKIEQQSINIMELNEKLSKLEAKVIRLREQKRSYVELNIALVTEIKSLQVVISRQQKSLDSLVKEHIIDPSIRKMKVAQQKQTKYKQKYNLIF
jgi:regulator of replication initiation timing